MKPLFFSGTTGGLFFISLHLLSAQNVEKPVVPKDSLAPSEVIAPLDEERKIFFLWRNAQVTGGQLTLPFKIRRSPEHNTFRLTTDVTLGGYIGYTRRLSSKKDYYLTVPLTAGLTFINLSDSNTTLDRVESVSEEVVPGLTWSSGVILQMDRYSLGLMFGKDYASSVGNQWEYHGKLWWSFGVGFVFLQ